MARGVVWALVRALEQGAFECGAVNDYVYFY